MLLYALLHLSGFDLSLDDLRAFRQVGSRTPGHPEFGHTAGVETTTGPLGQGFANGVGMALAARRLASLVDSSGDGAASGADSAAFHPVTHRVFGIVSDGDLMEGVAAEAASMAGHLGLGAITYIYDDNKITIEGETGLTFSEDVPARFRAYGWHVLEIDGHDHDAIAAALDEAVGETERPSLVCAHTHIAQGSPGKVDSEASHGAPLGDAEVKATKTNLGWPLEPTFHVPEDVREWFATWARARAGEHAAWDAAFAGWEAAHPDRKSVV